MTEFECVGRKTSYCKSNSRFLHYGGKCAAFGRIAEFECVGRKTSYCKSNSRFLHCGGKCAAFGRNDGV
jgi:hypothetical protein